MIRSINGQVFYAKRDTYLLPPHLTSEELMEMRKRLPRVNDSKTILDVISGEMEKLPTKEYADEVIGPCLAMPRVLYGSREYGGRDNHNESNDMATDQFNDHDFMTLRYHWHSLPDAIVNKYQKVLIDVGRIHKSALKGEARNIHSPIKDHCRDLVPRYSSSIFRVNHYLDSFEAYSYRNDARGKESRNRKVYDEKGKDAGAVMDDDIRPWFKSFVESVGNEKAKILLAGAGEFVQLT